MRSLCEKGNGIGFIAGIIYQPIFLAFVAVAVYLNPWLDIRTGALSDLVSSMANEPWIFNGGLLITSLIGMVFAFDFIRKMEMPLNYLWYILIASLLSFMIVSIFPEDTKVFVVPEYITVHKFFTLLGFFTLSITILLFSLYWILKSRWIAGGIALLTYGGASSIIVYYFGQPDDAILEISMGSLSFVWGCLTLYYHCKLRLDKNEGT